MGLHKTLAIVDKDKLDMLLSVEETLDQKCVDKYRSLLIDNLIHVEMPKLQEIFDAIMETGFNADTSQLQLKLKTLHDLEQSLNSTAE